MFAFNRLLVVVGLCFIFDGCNNSSPKEEKKNTQATVETKSANADGENIINFTVNNQNVSSTGHSISRFMMKGKIGLNITSSMYKDGRTVNINVAGASIGRYPMSGGTVGTIGVYFPNYLKEMSNTYIFQSGEVNITLIDTVNNIVNAEFSGRVRNSNKEELEIKDGKVINGKLMPGMTMF
jgi:hypothetical protein